MFGYSSSSGHIWRPKRVARSAPKHASQYGCKRRRGSLPDRLIQRRKRARFPQHLPQPRRLAIQDEPLLDRFIRGSAGKATFDVSYRFGQPDRRESIAPFQSLPIEEPSEEIERAGHGGNRRGSHAFAIDKLDIRLLNQDTVLCAEWRRNANVSS